MLTTTMFQPPANNYNLNMGPQQTGNMGPSPPENYNYASTMAQTPPSSSSVSPESVYYNVHTRQLHPRRKPLYIPAALRPTEFPTHPTNIPNRPRALDTPPASKDNSFDSGKDYSPQLENSTQSLNAQVEEENLMRLGLSRAASEDLMEDLDDIVGPPTTAHWKPDVSATMCKVCGVGFTWWFRRHHCRRCGHLVCDNHIKRRVPLDHNARFHPDGQESKACDRCYDDWTVVKRLRHSRAASVSDSQNSSQGTTVPPLGIPTLRRTPAPANQVGSMAHSEGMIWSTF